MNNYLTLIQDFYLEIDPLIVWFMAIGCKLVLWGLKEFNYLNPRWSWNIMIKQHYQDFDNHFLIMIIVNHAKARVECSDIFQEEYICADIVSLAILSTTLEVVGSNPGLDRL